MKDSQWFSAVNVKLINEMRNNLTFWRQENDKLLWSFDISVQSVMDIINKCGEIKKFGQIIYDSFYVV